jgi:hypothetical protein
MKKQEMETNRVEEGILDFRFLIGDLERSK